MGADGNMRNWWENETVSNFGQRTQCMEDQYSALTYAGMHLNGKLTLGENIADNGGIKIAYKAWVSSLPKYILRLPKTQNLKIKNVPLRFW